MFYDRKIKYLNYYENGERIGGCGFVKLEVREQDLRLEITVKGLYPTDTFARDVILRGADSEITLGQIEIHEGSGKFCHFSRIEREGDTAQISYDRLQEIKIPIGGKREVLCLLSAAPERTAAMQTAEFRAADAAPPAESDVAAAEEVQPEEPAVAAAEEVRPAESAVAAIEEVQPAESAVAAIEEVQPAESAVAAAEEIRIAESAAIKTEEVRAEEPEPAREQPQPTKPPKLLEDKWKQLSAIYPHIQPFDDDRDYLSMTPSDFVVFPAKNYRAVNNSFLLHGYYNYHHLILARVEQRGQIFYYIGVPGNYYDREKQVAVMFGFESFECASEPAKTGDFGYYMMRTEL